MASGSPSQLVPGLEQLLMAHPEDPDGPCRALALLHGLHIGPKGLTTVLPVLRPTLATRLTPLDVLSVRIPDKERMPQGDRLLVEVPEGKRTL